MPKAPLLLASAASLLLALVASGGCGGGSTGGSGSSSGGGLSSSSSGGTSGSSSGVGVGSSSGGAPTDGPACTAPTSIPANDLPGYTAPVPVPNACTATQLASFISGCDSETQSMSACDMFQTDPSNQGCITCLFDYNDGGVAGNGGGLLLSAAGGAFVGGNLPGCIALEDTTNGPACAAELEPLVQCQAFGCNTCDSQMSYDDCIMAVNAGACMSYLNAVQTPCMMDLADGGVFFTKCSDDSAIINVICGTGP
jgi:hypothetical protein